ncbi:MAG: multinuclear nonheme iron-dependent oxidase, partial [Burkholderiales bacterium]
MSRVTKSRKPDYLGFGLGLRIPHYDEILATRPKVDWFEVLSENYLVPGGKPLHYLERIRANYPVVMHGVSLSIGGTDPLNRDYLKQLKTLADRIEPKWISDHLCWTGVGGLNLHDLMPLPYTEDAVKHVVSRVNQVQD